MLFHPPCRISRPFENPSFKIPSKPIGTLLVTAEMSIDRVKGIWIASTQALEGGRHVSTGARCALYLLGIQASLGREPEIF